MKVLWLASWYPSRIEPFNGDFVQRHAEAVSLYHDVEVIHVIKDKNGTLTKGLRVEYKEKGRLKEQIVYYYNRLYKIPLLGQLLSYWNYQQVFKRQIKKYLEENDKPDLVHVHVCWKAGLIALWMKRKYGFPYVVTEHSTFFLPEAQENIFKSSFYLKKCCRTILRKASAVSVVSAHLGRCIQNFANVKGQRYNIIPNAVNTAVFRPIKKTDSFPFELVHISSLSPQKNFDTIIEALCLLKQKQSDFVLRVFGSEGERWLQKIADAGLAGHVFFYGEVPQPQLAPYLQKADALILFSHYETFGCVLIEAMACSVPVVVNDIPPMREIVVENINGLIVQNRTEALHEALVKLIEKKVSFDTQALANHAKREYGYEGIGQMFSAFYESVVDGNNQNM